LKHTRGAAAAVFQRMAAQASGLHHPTLTSTNLITIYFIEMLLQQSTHITVQI
jgi:hypothetical protein